MECGKIETQVRPRWNASYLWSSLVDLERIAGAPSYILLLYVISNKHELGLTDENLDEIKRGAKLQQARLIGASDDVNKRRGALAPAGVGGGFKPATDVRMEPAA